MRLFLIVLGLFIGGCSEQDKALPYPLTLTKEGLGAIHPDTPFEEIPTLMLGFECEKLTAVSSYDQGLIYQIKRGEDPIAHIVSDRSGKRVASIHLLSPLIKDAYDQAIHEPLKEKPFLCVGERCSDPASPEIFYTIDPKNRTILEITYQKL